jgi:hypothetical protein
VFIQNGCANSKESLTSCHKQDRNVFQGTEMIRSTHPSWFMMKFCFAVDRLQEALFPFQQLELITPFQLYFNPELIFKHFQVSGLYSNCD